VVVNKHIKLNHHKGSIHIKKEFAEKYLSHSALKMGRFSNGEYIFDSNSSSFVVFYELPMLFNFDFMFIMRGLINYCLDYLKENNINDSNIYIKYMDNMKKDIK